MTRFLPVAALVVCGQLLAGCAATQPENDAAPVQRTLADVMADDDETLLDRVNDPWQGWNRRVYDFNARFERYVFIPVVEGYRRALPQFLRTSVHKFMRNIREVLNVGNALLQFRVRTAGRSTGRFVVNSTAGFAGLLDPATEIGLFYQKDDFGQTLGVWGLGPGPYMVLPLLGPSSARDAFGLPSTGTRGSSWTCSATSSGRRTSSCTGRRCSTRSTPGRTSTSATTSSATCTSICGCARST